ncbi:MAG: hemin uptake protein HemP [Hyphomicrobiales bacterium]|nr:hemin uptake protein HemP [Hyphomicrobiales bacterium]
MSSRNGDRPGDNTSGNSGAVASKVGESRPRGAVSDSSHDVSNLIKLDARELMAGRRALILDLDGQQYVLRLTSNNKLILTK